MNPVGEYHFGTTMSSLADPTPSDIGDPAWPVALLFPPQGQWSEDEYLSLQNRTNWLVELSDGRIEVLPMPNPLHQRIALYLYLALRASVLATSRGEVLVAPLPVRLKPGKYRDPDIAFFKPGRIPDPECQPEGADLVIEVVSDDEEDRRRDLVTKRQEYAEACIAEYWIVDPKTETISVLVLDGNEYRLHGEFRPGETATSVLLPDFSVDVKATFAAGRGM
jgi:Uma2 family endonuclease